MIPSTPTSPRGQLPHLQVAAPHRRRPSRPRSASSASITLFCAIFTAILNPLLAQPQNGPDLAGFPTLAERNIFDPSRSRRPPPRSEETRPAPPSRPPVDSIVLTGTMLYSGNAFAFFSGSNPDYNQILGAGQELAGFTVTEISTSQVVLLAQTNRLVLPVGNQLRREGDQPWELAALDETPAATSEPGPDGPERTSAPTANDAAASGDADELLKRLMERRQKEMSP